MGDEKTFLDGRVIVKTGDITAEDVDAVVNAANSGLMGGGGVDGAIHRAGGPAIVEECKLIRRTTHPDGLPTGQAVITTAGRMPAKYVIHTVGPVWRGGDRDEAELLAAAYRNSLALAEQHGLGTIAFPSISTGAYGFPKDRAARIAAEAIEDFLKQAKGIREVRLVFFSPDTAETFLRHCGWS